MARKGKKSYRKKGNLPNREVNVSTKVQTNKVKTKVNGGVFIYTGAISAAELAKALDVAVSEIIKFLFMQGK
ncbi:MAG: hypothetical protein GXY57_00305, partial [Erysipelotrichaceae bacterium]|nr:hypothetical protein [Erysipelotrichaceae bacterium]